MQLYYFLLGKKFILFWVIGKKFINNKTQNRTSTKGVYKNISYCCKLKFKKEHDSSKLNHQHFHRTSSAVGKREKLEVLREEGW